MATTLRIPHGPLGPGVSSLHFLGDPPIQVCILMAAIIADQSAPANLNAQGYEVTHSVALSELVKPSDAAVIEQWLLPRLADDQICDECSLRMSRDVPAEELGDPQNRHVFAITDSGVASFFLCEWCYEHWGDYDGLEGLPNIMRTLDKLDKPAN